MTPTFTIITPSMNHGRFLAECLQSVASQSDVLLEHLVFDGGSTDESASVAAGFPHITWTQEPDAGMSDAINKGFDKAKGEWVLWLNADDRLKPGALAGILQSLETTDADVVYGDWDFIDTTGNHLRHMRSLKWSRFVHVQHHCYIGSTAAFYRRSTIIDGGHRLRTDFHYAMDSEFYARLDAEHFRFEHIPRTIADFRLHGNNASQRNLGKPRTIGQALAAEHQFAESRAIRRIHGITLFKDPYLNGIIDGIMWIAAKALKAVIRTTS